ncbi:MAG TPA: glycosyltransferase family 2 protein [Candidatus Aquilonibacter sp.]|nr:glycosyltransferase family 2 protein [Candidatus Aquilonibacter sp.]
MHPWAHLFWIGSLGFVTLLWILLAIDLAIGVPSMPALAKFAPLADERCPSVSVLFGARDEAEKMPAALGTFLALDYPRYEVIAVDDRSLDATGEILSAAASKDARLRPVRVDSLPSGWLGKPHALQTAYENSGGEWLVFTDADVHFEPDLLRRAIALAEAKGWDHLTLLGEPKMYTLGEKITMTFFGLALVGGTRPYAASNPRSSWYAGVGAFQLIRRSAYEKMGTHRRLAMEVVDDVKLGKLVKEAGISSGVAKAGSAVSVHWHAGMINIVRGTTKNFFATSGYRLWLSSLHVFGLLLMCVFPVIALPFVHGWAFALAVIAIAFPVIAEIGVAIEFRAPVIFALTYPIGALVFAWMIARSAFVTLKQGGIVWRGTFYPLEELRRGVV